FSATAASHMIQTIEAPELSYAIVDGIYSSTRIRSIGTDHFSAVSQYFFCRDNTLLISADNYDIRTIFNESLCSGQTNAGSTSDYNDIFILQDHCLVESFYH